MLLVIASLALAFAGGIALIASEVWHAPEGYEDENGFHVVAPQKPAPRGRHTVRIFGSSRGRKRSARELALR